MSSTVPSKSNSATSRLGFREIKVSDMMNYLLSKMICIQRQDRTLPFTNPRVKQQSGHYTLRAAEGAFQCEKGRPAQQPVKPAPAKAFREVEGRPTWKLTMPATALAFPRGRPSPRLAGQYEGPSMRAVGWFPANNLGNAASGRDHIGARPFARKESESAKGPFKPQGGSFREIARPKPRR